MIHVPAGAIKPPEPKPLTEAQKRKLRKLAGGDAPVSQLKDLEAKFSKPERVKPLEAHKPSKQTNNGWAR